MQNSRDAGTEHGVDQRQRSLCIDLQQRTPTASRARQLCLLEGVQEPRDFEHEYGFRLVSPMPREVYELKAGGTVKERIGRSGNLIVERIGGDESDEEEE